MSTLRYFISSVSHKNGEGYSLAVFLFDASRLAKIATQARETLLSIVDGSDIFGSVIIRGLVHGGFLEFSPDSNSDDNLEAKIGRAVDSACDPVELTSEEFDKLRDQCVDEFTDGGFSISENRVFIIARPRKGEGDAVTISDFDSLVPALVRA